VTITVFRQGSKLAGGRYVLERRLGAGGMATVWLATDTRLQRGVAIKLPSDALTADRTFARRFEREARTAAALSHPNLVSVYDYGSEGERPYLVSEFINGASLAQLRERGEAPGVELLAPALLEALGHIHASGIVHRDVKPANVLVEGADRILLTDFGIAQSTEETRLTMTGNVIGTYDYLAPEVRRGERAGPTSDLFACGVLLSEQLSDSDPDRYHRLVSRLTAHDPRSRPSGAEAAMELLEPHDPVTAPMSIEDTTATAAAPPPAPPLVPPRPPRRVLDETSPRRPQPSPASASPRRFGWILAIGLLAAGTVAVVVIALASGGGSDPERDRRASSDNAAASAEGGREETNSSPTTETTEPAPSEPTETEPEPTEPTETTETTETPVAVVPTGGTDSERGIALNDEGFALLQAGDVEGALPKLEKSVASFPSDSTEIDYAYALFNYAQALRLSGDPASAIPLLEKRLEFSDYKLDEVEAELAAAQEAAGG